MAIADDIADGLANIESDFGQTFTLGVAPNQTVYPCNASSPVEALPFGVGGHNVELNLVVNIRAALFGGNPLPQPEQTGIFSGDGNSYRIENVVSPPGAAFIQLHLVSIQRGA